LGAKVAMMEAPTRMTALDWAVTLRREFSPKSMIEPDGSIDQSYFVSRGVCSPWSDEERALLLRGVKQFGVGRWNDIIHNLLPLRTYAEVRLQCMRLLGCQNLQKYERTHWQGSELDVKAQFEQNKREAMQAGVWLGGVFPDTTFAKASSSSSGAAAAAAAPSSSSGGGGHSAGTKADVAAASAMPNAIDSKQQPAASTTSSSSPAQEKTSKRKRSAFVESSSDKDNVAAAAASANEHVGKKNKSDASEPEQPLVEMLVQ